jgi:pilus assembly protein Flp/PilA
MRNLILSMVRSEEGQDLIEYGLLIGIITLATLTAIRSIGPTVAGYFSSLDTLLT